MEGSSSDSALQALYGVLLSLAIILVIVGIICYIKKRQQREIDNLEKGSGIQNKMLKPENMDLGTPNCGDYLDTPLVDSEQV